MTVDSKMTAEWNIGPFGRRNSQRLERSNLPKLYLTTQDCFRLRQRDARPFQSSTYFLPDRGGPRPGLFASRIGPPALLSHKFPLCPCLLLELRPLRNKTRPLVTRARSSLRLIVRCLPLIIASELRRAAAVQRPTRSISV